MSAIRLRGATSGTTDVVAAAIAGDGVLTLPSGTGTLATAAYVDAAVAAGGKVLQIVSASTDTPVASSSSTYAATGLTATITPSSDTSKVLVLVNQNGLRKQQNTSISLQLNRGVTTISTFAYAAYTNSTSDNDVGGTSVSILDAPATASAVTYSTTFNSTSNAAITNVQLGPVMSTIILMEISA